MSIWHIYPQNDLQEHETFNTTCPCGTKSETTESGDLLIIHKAYDNREAFEILVKDLLKTLDKQP